MMTQTRRRDGLQADPNLSKVCFFITTGTYNATKRRTGGSGRRYSAEEARRLCSGGVTMEEISPWCHLRPTDTQNERGVF